MVPGIGDSYSNLCFQQNWTQIIVSDFQNIDKPFPCLNDWWNSHILCSYFPIHTVNITACGTTLLAVGLSTDSTHDHIFVCVLSACKQFMPLCCPMCPQTPISLLLATLGIEHGMFTPSSFMMSSWSFATLQNEHGFSIVLLCFPALGKAFSVQLCMSCMDCLLDPT